MNTVQSFTSSVHHLTGLLGFLFLINSSLQYLFTALIPPTLRLFDVFILLNGRIGLHCRISNSLFKINALSFIHC